MEKNSGCVVKLFQVLPVWNFLFLKNLFWEIGKLKQLLG